MADIEQLGDLKKLVDAFYTKVRKDDLLGSVFSSRIEEDKWDLHLKRMYSFWNTVLFFQKDYRGNPFSRHKDLPIETKHFERWIFLFSETIDEHFTGPRANETKRRAKNMANMFLKKLGHLSTNTNYVSIL